MPELPQVAALRDFLAGHLVGRVIARVELASVAVLKTYDPPLSALLGCEIGLVQRFGKWLDVDAQGVHLVFHLARGGWLAWHDQLPTRPLRAAKGPICLRVGLDGPEGFDLTEAGTQRNLAVHVVRDPREVPAIASLGLDPLGAGFTPAMLDRILAGAGRAQIKGLLCDQRMIAGIGNAYSDEILYAAKLSPFKPASSLDAPQRARLFDAIRQVLGQATEGAMGLGPAELKDNKRARLRVHGRTGQICEVCGSRIADVNFADSVLQYCPGCQTDGKVLADRRMSRLLK